MPVLSLETPLGRLHCSWRRGYLVSLDWNASAVPLDDWPADLKPPMAAIAAYFERPVALDAVPVALEGTPFQLRVWAALRAIPMGETRSYGELAVELGSGARAVGNACRRNPCPIVVPCHRVVARGGLGGYAGHTDGTVFEIKRWLLRHEGVLR